MGDIEKLVAAKASRREIERALHQLYGIAYL
jgi:hypothetical protein